MQKTNDKRNIKLYFHQTSGGAKYLCSECVPGTNEGNFKSKYIVRIDGDITQDAELTINTKMIIKIHKLC